MRSLLSFFLLSSDNLFCLLFFCLIFFPISDKNLLLFAARMQRTDVLGFHPAHGFRW